MILLHHSSLYDAHVIPRFTRYDDAVIVICDGSDTTVYDPVTAVCEMTCVCII